MSIKMREYVDYVNYVDVPPMEIQDRQFRTFFTGFDFLKPETDKRVVEHLFNDPDSWRLRYEIIPLGYFKLEKIVLIGFVVDHFQTPTELKLVLLDLPNIKKDFSDLLMPVAFVVGRQRRLFLNLIKIPGNPFRFYSSASYAIVSEDRQICTHRMTSFPAKGDCIAHTFYSPAEFVSNLTPSQTCGLGIFVQLYLASLGWANPFHPFYYDGLDDNVSLGSLTLENFPEIHDWCAERLTQMLVHSGEEVRKVAVAAASPLLGEIHD